MLGEHGHDGVEDDVSLGEVGGGAFDEDVLGMELDAGVAAIDDGREGENGAVLGRESDSDKRSEEIEGEVLAAAMSVSGMIPVAVPSLLLTWS